GWYSRQVINMFVRYVETICERYKNKVKYWLTFNEVDSMIRHPAARGGFTTVICMANTNPIVDNEDTFNYVKEKSKNACINVLQA
ncbi:family 1 glycosylhydrolase, partial [Clostridioides difficile]|uniref:family 1 glycosylhydrolase n=1 Tax=Clostridioides difficile TaxID=1496 RepID=UPI003F8D0D02